MASAVTTSTASSDDAEAIRSYRERIARGERVELDQPTFEKVLQIDALTENARSSMISTVYTREFLENIDLGFNLEGRSLIHRSHLYFFENFLPRMIEIEKFNIVAMLDMVWGVKNGDIKDLGPLQKKEDHLVCCLQQLSSEVQDLCDSWKQDNLPEFYETDRASFDANHKRLLSIAFRIHFIVEYLLRSLQELYPEEKNLHASIFQTSDVGHFKPIVVKEDTANGIYESHEITDLEGLFARTTRILERNLVKHMFRELTFEETMADLRALFEEVVSKNGPFIQARLKSAQASAEPLQGPFYRE